jgi:ribosomal protein S18 acetylase RimI-like enzyme
MTDLALVERLERLLLHVWPAVQTQMHGNWALRFAHGYSARANAASALSGHARIDDALLRLTGNFYGERLLPAQFRISPLAHSNCIKVLQSAGYGLKDEAVTMSAVLDGSIPRHPAVRISGVASGAWLSGVTALNSDESKREPDHLKSITSRMRKPVAFASIAHEGRTSGYAICAIHEGWAELGSIIIAPEARGIGLGRGLVGTLLSWAQSEGAQSAFLQVDVENSAAISLYRSLGFTGCYRYTTWRKPV